MEPTGYDPDPLSAARRRSAEELKRRYAIERKGVAYLGLRDQDDQLRLIELSPDLQPPEYVIGRGASLDVAVPWDEHVSTVHASVRLMGTVWVLDDVDSHNGTFVNETRVTERHRLSDRDLIRVGGTVIAYRAAISPDGPPVAAPTPTKTAIQHTAISLTDDQRRVLVELCRPLLEADGLPASTPTNDEIAKTLFMVKATVASHLRRIAEKLAISGRRGSLRDMIAREAIRRQIVTRRDVTR